MVIIGEVNFRGEITLPLTLRDATGEEHTFPAVFDTGFTGFLTLPPAVIEALSLEKVGEDVVRLGDGTESSISVYRTTIVWFGQDFSINALLSDDFPLIGLRLTKGCFITHHAVDGGAVVVYRPQ